jgi:hypothetical protein
MNKEIKRMYPKNERNIIDTSVSKGTYQLYSEHNKTLLQLLPVAFHHRLFALCLAQQVHKTEIQWCEDEPLGIIPGTRPLEKFRIKQKKK